MTYDALDRQTTRTYPADSTLNVSIFYDSAGHGYGVGRLTGTTDQSGSLSRSYDERGNITTDARTTPLSQLFSTGFTYESAGRLSSITYASAGWLVSYSRDSAGQITYVSSTRPAPRCDQPCRRRDPHAIRPGLLMDLWQRHHRHADVRSGLPHHQHQGRRNIEHPVFELRLRRRQQHHQHHRQCDARR